jgi:hypothetical protein
VALAIVVLYRLLALRARTVTMNAQLMKMCNLKYTLVA